MVIFYQNFEWGQRKSLVEGLPIPKNCRYCGGSAYLYNETMLWWSNSGFIECQDKKSGSCLRNHYGGANIKGLIDLWNDYNTERIENE